MDGFCGRLTSVFSEQSCGRFWNQCTRRHKTALVAFSGAGREDQPLGVPCFLRQESRKRLVSVSQMQWEEQNAELLPFYCSGTAAVSRIFRPGSGNLSTVPHTGVQRVEEGYVAKRHPSPIVMNVRHTSATLYLVYHAANHA